MVWKNSNIKMQRTKWITFKLYHCPRVWIYRFTLKFDRILSIFLTKIVRGDISHFWFVWITPPSPTITHLMTRLSDSSMSNFLSLLSISNAQPVTCVSWKYIVDSLFSENGLNIRKLHQNSKVAFVVSRELAEVMSLLTLRFWLASWR